MPSSRSRSSRLLDPLVAALRPLLLLNLALQVLIVLTGGLVRLTGSGLGCPTWPQCDPGSITPTFQTSSGIHPYIEFGNRLLSVVVGVVALATLVAVLAATRRGLRARSPFRLLAALVLAGTVLQAVLGGITVLTALHPVTVMAHFLISMALVAVSTLLVWHDRAATRAAGPRVAVPRLVRRLALVTAAVAGVVLVLGTVVTGSGPHSGDADQPARFGFDPRTVAWLHADSVMLFAGLVVAMVVATQLLPGAFRARRAWRLVLGVTLAQGLVGYVQYFTGVPEPLVLVHMLGAASLVAALAWAVQELHARAPAAALRRTALHEAPSEPRVPRTVGRR